MCNREEAHWNGLFDIDKKNTQYIYLSIYLSIYRRNYHDSVDVITFILAYSWSAFSQIRLVNPRGQCAQSTPIFSISTVFIVLSSKNIISSKGMPVSALSLSKCCSKNKRV